VKLGRGSPEEERFRTLVQHTSDVIAAVDASGVLRYVSPSAERILGRSTGALIGRPAFEIIHPDDLERAVGAFEGMLAAPGVNDPLEMRFAHADGSWRYGEVVANNLLDDPDVRAVILDVRDITERKYLEQQLEHQALHDPLTRLPNRALLMDRLAHALEAAHLRSSWTAVVFLDLDRFKLVNDSYGHATGDELLRELAERLRATARIDDTVARFGGDVFVVVRENVHDRREAEALGDDLLTAVHEVARLDGMELLITASVGIAIGGSDMAPDVLVRNADSAMHRAKNMGRGRIHFFHERLRREATARLELETSLYQALERDELRVLFQPVVSLESGAIVGGEALVRWQHPVRGMLEPVDFIETAEDTGVIEQLGIHVLETGLAELGSWGDEQLSIAVNVSPTQLRDPALPDVVAESLEAAGIAPDRLTIEITEHVLVGDGDVDTPMHRALGALHDQGVRVALDDFGTGYSSLRYLKHLPLDQLKIDREFVAGLQADRHDTAILVSTIALARSLGIGVVAEGVETPEQVAALRVLGCPLAQGHHFARPLQSDAFGALVARRPRW
jgi:diguanylate cyclase (GGDEF)-like protein/PAS domain S-box-containing protein